MALYPITTSSPDKKIIQVIEELDTNNLSVIHHINLAASEDARLGEIDPIDKATDPDAFDEACVEFGIDPKSATIFLIFNYDIFDVDRNFRTVKTFPQDDDGYYVPGKGKVLAVACPNSSNNSTSKTGGEAL